MSRRLKLLIFVVLLSMLAVGCGGGGSSGGSGSSASSLFDVSPPTLSFSAQVDAEAPAEQVVRVSARSAQTEIPGVVYSAGVLDSVIDSIVDSSTMEIRVRVGSPRIHGVGTHQARIEVRNSRHSVMIPVVYTISAIPPGEPRIDTISPHVVAPSVASAVVIRGSGFNRYENTAAPQLLIGGSPATGVDVLGDSEIRANSPALAAGVHAVSLVDPGAGFDSSAVLTVLGPRTYATTRLATEGEKASLIYDERRAALYLVNTTSDTLERYRHQSGTDWTLDTLSLSGLSDAALSADGNTLVLVDGSRFFEVDPDAGTLVAGDPVDAPLRTFDSVDQVAAINGTNVIAVGANQWSDVYRYDTRLERTERLTFFNNGGIEIGYSIYQPWLFEVADGSRLYFGEHGSTGSRLYELDAASLSIRETGLVTGLGGYTDLAAAADLSRFVVNGQDIFDADFSRLGALDAIHTNAVFSPDAGGVYVFVDSLTSNRLRQIDLADPALPVQLGADHVFAESPGLRSRMVLSRDGNTLFIAGNRNLHIIDLSEFSF